MIFFVLLIKLTACEKTPFDCVKKSGSEKTVPIETESFHSIKSIDGINIFIKQGDHQEIHLTSSENLISDIKIYVDKEGILNVANENTCNWVREFKDINLHITTDTLAKIYQFGFGKIQSEGVLSFKNLAVETKDGTGDVQLEVDNERLAVVSNKLSNFYLSGNTEKLIVGFYYNDGIFYGKDLVAKTVNINHIGTNTIEVTAIESLTAAIESSGNIICHGNPANVEITDTGIGQLIKK